MVGAALVVRHVRRCSKRVSTNVLSFYSMPSVAVAVVLVAEVDVVVLVVDVSVTAVVAELVSVVVYSSERHAAPNSSANAKLDLRFADPCNVLSPTCLDGGVCLMPVNKLAILTATATLVADVEELRCCNRVRGRHLPRCDCFSVHDEAVLSGDRGQVQDRVPNVKGV